MTRCLPQGRRKESLAVNDCLFCKIIAGEIPSEKVYEDELCCAFHDISRMAPVHFLVVPKQHYASAAEINEENAALVGHIFTVIARLAKEMKLENGFRVVTNCGKDADQSVPHLHFHVLAGKKLGTAFD